MHGLLKETDDARRLVYSAWQNGGSFVSSVKDHNGLTHRGD